MRNLKRSLINFSRKLLDLHVIIGIVNIFKDTFISPCSPPEVIARVLVFPILLSFIVVAGLIMDIIAICKTIPSLYIKISTKIKLYKYMTGKNAKTPQELFIKLYDDFKRKLDVKKILAWKETLVNNFGEENVQITTNINDFMEGEEFKNLREENVANTFNNLSRSTQFKFIFIIRFRHIEITNSRRQKADIYDLFVRFILGHEDELQSYQMMVTSFNLNNYLSGYKHSHMHRINSASGFFPTWESVCLGEGPLALMVNRRVKLKNINEFKLLIYNIKQYVKWESIEGGPFIRMEEIRPSSNMNNPHLLYYSRGIETFGGNYHIDEELLANIVLEQIKEHKEYFLSKADILIDRYSIMIDPNSIDLKILILLGLHKYIAKFKRNGVSNKKILPLLIYKDGHSFSLQDAAYSVNGEELRSSEKIIEFFENVFKGPILSEQYVKSINKKFGNVVFSFKGNPITFKIVGLDGEKEKKEQSKESTPKELLKRAETLSKKFQISKTVQNETIRRISAKFTKELSKHLERRESAATANLLVKEGSSVDNIKEVATTDQVPVPQGE